MTLNEKLGHTVTLTKYFANEICLMFLSKTLIWNKTMLPI